MSGMEAYDICEIFLFCPISELSKMCQLLNAYSGINGNFIQCLMINTMGNKHHYIKLFEMMLIIHTDCHSECINKTFLMPQKFSQKSKLIG